LIPKLAEVLKVNNGANKLVLLKFLTVVSVFHFRKAGTPETSETFIQSNTIIIILMSVVAVFHFRKAETPETLKHLFHQI
jgi:hypothetical protein